MAAMIWVGVALALAGLGGLGWCMAQALAVKRGGMSPEDGRRRMAMVRAVNLAAVATGFLGLAAVAVGLILG